MINILDIKKYMDPDIEIMELQKMIFIYNALKTGWSVKMVTNGKFEFKQSKNNVKKEVFLDDYLTKFIQNNLNIENIKENSTS